MDTELLKSIEASKNFFAMNDESQIAEILKEFENIEFEGQTIAL